MDIAVCDDNELFLREIEGQLRTIPLAEGVHLFPDLGTFLLSIDGGRRYDAVLMDIDWHSKADGMDAAEELLRLCPETRVIYVTGYVDRFSQQIFLRRANLSGYLTKPVDIGLLRANLQKVADSLPYQETPSLMLRRKGATVSIPMREIHYMESRNHNVMIHTAGETVTVYERLEGILRSLPVNFFQCHKSYIVNMGHISHFQHGEVIMRNGERVPVSRARYAEARKSYFTYMGNKF